METKKCNKCGEVKELTAQNFHKHKSRKDGFREICKTCRGVKMSRGESRIIAIQNNQKKCSKCKTIKVLSDFRKKGDFLNSSCKECEKVEIKLYRENNQEKINKQRRNYFKEKKKDPNYKNDLTTKKREYKRKRKKEDPLYKAKLDISKLIGESLKRLGWTKNSKTFEILGCDWDTFKTQIEKQFIDGMTWDNHGQYGWHYDHIYPISLATTQDEANKLNHYTNFQPLWWEDNLKKSNKVLP
jgi:hypothetical protein